MTTQRRAQILKQARATNTRRPVKGWVLRDPEVLRVVFQIFDDLTALRRHCAEKVESARKEEHLYQTLRVRPDHSGVRSWQQMLKRVTRCWCVLDDLVCTNRLVVTRCQAVYRDLLGIEVAWQRIKGPAYFHMLIVQTLDRVRQLLIQQAQWQDHQG